MVVDVRLEQKTDLCLVASQMSEINKIVSVEAYLMAENFCLVVQFC